MQEAVFAIGGHGLRLVGDRSLEMVLSVPGMRQFLAPESRVDMTVWLDRPFIRPACKLRYEYHTLGKSVRCLFGIAENGLYYCQFGFMSTLCYDRSNPHEVVVTPLRSIEAVRMVLWMAYALMGMDFGALPIHSSTVVCEGRAVLCLGESGTGKSTHTRLWQEHIPGATLLNDDSPIVAVEDGKAVVYGSPWSGKTDCFRPERFPIAGLVRIEQRPFNRITPLPAVFAVAALQPSCPPALAHEEYCLGLVMRFVGDVVNRVPIYRLECLPDKEAAQLCYTTIFKA